MRAAARADVDDAATGGGEGARAAAAAPKPSPAATRRAAGAQGASGEGLQRGEEEEEAAAARAGGDEQDLPEWLRGEFSWRKVGLGWGGVGHQLHSTVCPRSAPTHPTPATHTQLQQSSLPHTLVVWHPAPTPLHPTPTPTPLPAHTATAGVARAAAPVPPVAADDAAVPGSHAAGASGCLGLAARRRQQRRWRRQRRGGGAVRLRSETLGFGLAGDSTEKNICTTEKCAWCVRGRRRAACAGSAPVPLPPPPASGRCRAAPGGAPPPSPHGSASWMRLGS